MKKFYLIAVLFILSGSAAIFSQTTTFNYTGNFQSYTIPSGCTVICVDVRGGRGMANAAGNSSGGLGGRVQATIPVTAGQVLRIYVGGGGIVSSAGGFNGGANGGVVACCPASNGGGGGGASDIRISPYGLANRLVVAGGGGGTGGNRNQGCAPGCGGGGGGGYYGGGGGGAYGGMPGAGGTQAAGGAGGTSCCGCPLTPQPGGAGISGAGGAGGGMSACNNQAANNPGCAGGSGGALTGGTGPNCTGGGGCPSTWAGASGGGGSNYTAGGVTGVVHTQGYQTGNGQVIITVNCVVLPITLVDFNAEYIKEINRVNISWQTASEKQNKMFTVERSANAENWETLVQVKGAGNSHETLNYSSFDDMPYPGTSYYRLKQTDSDGNFSYSGIQAVQGPAPLLADIFPNPVNENLTLTYTAESSQPLHIVITNVSGHVVAEQVINVGGEGEHNFEIPAASLLPGMYFISVKNAGKTRRLKFVKQ